MPVSGRGNDPKITNTGKALPEAHHGLQQCHNSHSATEVHPGMANIGNLIATTFTRTTAAIIIAVVATKQMDVITEFN